VANMIGTGVFLSAGFMAQEMSPGLILLAWVVGTGIALAGTRAYGEVARLVPRSGGEYRYLSELLHPYLGYLATADVLVVTGESESMLAEAAASDKPVYIYALPKRPRTISGWLREWVVARAREQPEENRTRGWLARGLRTLCSTIISHGLILPPRDLQALHQMLYRMGVARPLGAELVTARRPPLNETERVVRRVQVLMGMAQEELQH